DHPSGRPGSRLRRVRRERRAPPPVDPPGELAGPRSAQGAPGVRTGRGHLPVRHPRTPVHRCHGRPRRGEHRAWARRDRGGRCRGATFGAMSISSNRAETEPFFGPFMYGVIHVPNVDHYRNDFGLNGPEGDLMAARYLEQEIKFQGPETVAAFIGEPISTAM